MKTLPKALLSMYLRIWIEPNSTLQNQLVRWGLPELHKHYTGDFSRQRKTKFTQHNEGVGCCNEGNPNATIRRIGADCNEIRNCRIL